MFSAINVPWRLQTVASNIPGPSEYIQELKIGKKWGNAHLGLSPKLISFVSLIGFQDHHGNTSLGVWMRVFLEIKAWIRSTPSQAGVWTE